MEPTEDFIWGEVDDMLYKYRDGVNGVLLDNFKKSKALASEIIENAEVELKRCGEEKLRIFP